MAVPPSLPPLPSFASGSPPAVGVSAGVPSHHQQQQHHNGGAVISDHTRYNIWSSSSNPSGCYRTSDNDRLVTRVIQPTLPGSWQAVRTAAPYSHGRVTVDFAIIHASNLMIGCVPASFNAWNTYLGNTTGCGLSYRCNGNLRAVNDGSRTAGHASFAAGSLVRMILDFDAQHVELSVNGVSQGAHKFATAGLTGSALYAAVSTHDDGEAVHLTAPEPLLLQSLSSPSIPSSTPSPHVVAAPAAAVWNGAAYIPSHAPLPLPLPSQPPPLPLPSSPSHAVPHGHGHNNDGSNNVSVSSSSNLPLPENDDERRALAMLTSLGFGHSGHAYLLLLRAFGGNLQHVVNHLVKQQAFPYH